MCRLIVWAKVNDDPDPIKNARKFKPGMVVDILDDGIDPGSDIWKLGWWNVIDMPGVATISCANLLGADPEFYDEKLFLSLPEYPRKRVQKVDLNALATKSDAPTTLTKTAVDAATLTVIKITNLSVIGSNPAVIG